MPWPSFTAVSALALHSAQSACSKPHIHLDASFLQQPWLSFAAWQGHSCIQHQLSAAGQSISKATVADAGGCRTGQKLMILSEM